MIAFHHYHILILRSVYSIIAVNGTDSFIDITNEVMIMYIRYIFVLTSILAVAENYMSYIAPHSTTVDNDFDRLILEKENGFLWDIAKPGPEELPVSNGFPKQNNSEVGNFDNTSHG